jgi:hypothetical protein
MRYSQLYKLRLHKVLADNNEQTNQTLKRTRKQVNHGLNN